MDKWTSYDPVGKQIQFLDGRFYTKDNVSYYPGITTILGALDKGPQYKKWLQTNGINADWLAREAMDRGSRVHEAIQRFLLGEEVRWGTDDNQPIYHKDEWEMLAKFIDFYHGFKPKVIAVEIVIVSDTLQFGSQLDLICEIPGRDGLWYIDHKSGSLYDSAEMQLAAGAILWNECFPENPIKNTALLHLEAATRGRDKTGKQMQGRGWALKEIGEIEENWIDFAHVHAVWKRKNPNFRPMILTFPDRYKKEYIDGQTGTGEVQD